MRWKMIEIRLPASECRDIGWFNLIWGVDVFFNGLPVFKFFLLLHALFAWCFSG